ncbi:MAG: hypothetical protein AAB728_00785 [Patescibacteria group bacterium]
MPSVQNTFDRLEKLNAEAIEAVAAIVALSQEAAEEDPESVGGEFAAEVAAQWDAAADEHGWNPASAARVARGIVELCKQGE